MIASPDFAKTSHIKKRAFIAAFSRCGSLSKAAQRAKIDRRTHYNWLRDDPWYKQAFRQAIQEAGDALEDKLNDLAHEGNVTAAIFLLKGLRPERYRDSHYLKFEWDGDPGKLTNQQLDRLLEHELSAACGSDPDRMAAMRKQIEAEARARLAGASQVIDMEPVEEVPHE
jgi:hypothetical protein